MDSGSQLSDGQSVIPVLMGTDRNVTFILDTSETMAAVLGTVKNLLIQTLLTKASLRNSMFNIITYSYKISSLCDHMIPCAPDTVYEALGWLHTLRTSPGSDLLTALVTAFSDPACQSVHLLTASIPDSLEKTLNALSVFTSRPVRTFYVSGKPTLDGDTLDFLKCLTSGTRGSCYKLCLCSDRKAEQVTLLHSAERPAQDLPCCQVSCFQQTHPACFSPYWCSVRNPFSVTPCVSARMMRGSEFYPGCRVLARKEVDGFYYLGTIVHQLQDRGGVFTVMFDKPVTQGDVALTCQPDMVNITQAYGRSLVPGDTVLAPWEPHVNRYGPGRVVSGLELRDPVKGGGDGLVVLFWNGLQVHVPKNLALWIPASQHERIIQELQAHTFRSGYLSHAACCPYHCPSTASSACHRPVDSCPLLNSQCRDAVKADQRTELENAKAAPSTPSLSDLSDDEEEEANGKMNCPGLALVSRSVNTEISCLRRTLRASQSRPAWRYWKRGSPEPHHKQPGKVTSVGKSSPDLNSDSGYSSPNCTSTNHSSLFETVPNSVRRGATVKEAFGWTGPRLSPTEL